MSENKAKINPDNDPLLALRGSGKDIWADEPLMTTYAACAKVGTRLEVTRRSGSNEPRAQFRHLSHMNSDTANAPFRYEGRSPAEPTLPPITEPPNPPENPDMGRCASRTRTSRTGFDLKFRGL